MNKLAEHRRIRFESIEDCLAEVERILEAAREGRLQAIGNWTPGQILAHIASWIEYAYVGFPMKPAPAFLRWILRLRLGKMLESDMSRGVKIPGVKAGTTGMDEMETSEAGARLVAALKRLASSEDAPYPSPAFGRLTHEQRIKLNLRHAELHLGYLIYE
ncbi:MAG TPA: DUF1569 domain-containing protein [Pirellulaceae bacterium]|nr:DUF1569 domain-containing protein [Pirellulaceae bacterium]HMO91739.1 DUF1569 domain-containing protein [Pirellulaceae bacterium]HMP69798.1 DUF1569 domain-containing protein [Pirellulaceae bacterium]